MDPRIRALWARRQGLDSALAGVGPREVLVRTGWMRTVGGAGPYLGLFARAGVAREAVDRALAEGEICELPSVRGCTYLVPRDDFPLALAASRGYGDAAGLATAKRHLGVTDLEIDRLCLAILDALAGGAQDPRALKEAVGDAVRHLGDPGKKRGVTTTLSLGLGRLQTAGQIRRIPVNCRLDQQRFSYALWDLDVPQVPADELAAALAGRFFSWIGRASVDQLAWWGGLSKKAARAAAAAVGAVPVEGGPELAPPELGDLAPVPADPEVRLIGSLDNLLHLRREVAPLVDPADAARTVTGGGFGPGGQGTAAVSTVLDLPHHAIVDRGRLIGLWDYDVPNMAIVARTFPGVADATGAITATEAFVRDQLGDARSFSLDSPESRVERLAGLR